MYLIHDSHSPFQRKMCYLPVGLVPPCSIWPPVLPLNLTYCIFWSFFHNCHERTFLYRLLTCHIPNLMSIFLILGHLSIESVQVWGPLWYFITCLFFLWWGVDSPMPNFPAGGSPLVDCPRLHMQHICISASYLEAVSSIRNLRMHHVMVTKDPLNMVLQEFIKLQNCLF
jgi:hypothetical protein